MTDFQVTLLIAVGIVVAAYVGLIVVSFRSNSVLKGAARYADSLNVILPERLGLLVGQRLAHRRRANLLGVAAGTILALPIALALPLEGNSLFPAPILLVLAAGFAGGAIGSALGSLQRPPFVDKHAVHVARPQAVGITDYVSKFERRSLWIIVALPIATLMVSTALNATGSATTPILPPGTFSGPLTLLAILALIFSDVVGRRIIARAQPTASDDDLLWDDALRSVDVRGLLNAPTLLGVYATLISVSDLASAALNQEPEGATTILLNTGGFALVAVIVVWALASLVTQPQRHFLRRLWPHYATLTTPAPQYASRVSGQTTQKRSLAHDARG
jgi:hypothetical protein